MDNSAVSKAIVIDVPLPKPLDEMEWLYNRICRDLRAELLEKIQAAPPDFFERLVVELLVRLGYGAAVRAAGQTAGLVTGKVGDEGIDGVVQLDRLGLEHIYIQAKRWKGMVSRSEIHQFVGALHGRRASRGVFITTSQFSKTAREYAESISDRVALVDGAELVTLMFETGLGLAKVRTYEVMRVELEGVPGC